MKEHAKQFEQYCRMYEEVQTKINIVHEFQSTMVAGGKFQQADLKEYIEYKMKSQMANDLGS